jgi:hypothetical protein
MKPESISIDKFLQQEEAKGQDFLAILERDPQNAGHVRITPWTGEGCSCSSGLSVSRKLIASVEPTDNSHNCCGARHTVVKVHFAEGAAIPIGDVFNKLKHAGTGTEAVRSLGIIPEASHLTPGDWEPAEDAFHHFRDFTPGVPPVYCRLAGYTNRNCPPVIDGNGNVIRRGGWRRVPYFINLITGKPCNLHIDPCA